MKINSLKLRPAGYVYLLDKLGLTGIPHWHTSWVSSTKTHKSIVQGGTTKDIYPIQHWPGEAVGDHLAFALKYDGINLGLLAPIFAHAPQEALIAYIQSKPLGKYVRRIWFFYEFLTGKQLAVDNITTGNYIDALETTKYYTVANGEKSRRHRIVNNLLGPSSFCPIIRKTEQLSLLDATDLRQKCEVISNAYPPALLHRALSYIYHKETKSSFAIESIQPNASRTARFIALLQRAEKQDFCTKDNFIELQNHIVDPRFKEHEYRVSQNYVGQTVAYQQKVIHFICPKPSNLPDLMSGLIACHNRMQSGKVPPVIHAAAIAYGFVFLHPFEDGNGRIHRFLIHNILSLQEMVPRGLMLPVSAVMLKNPLDYDASLEAFSRPLLQLIDYQLDTMGQMIVNNDTACWYQYNDMTAQAEALYTFVNKTIKEELVEELSFLANYDNTKKAIQAIIDIPDRLLDLFIQLCLQNHGHLSAKKRSTHFDFLTDQELAAMEQAVNDNYNQPSSAIA